MKPSMEFAEAADFGQCLRLMRLGQAAEENIVALQRDDDRHVHPPLDLGDAAGGEDVAEHDHVGPEIAGEPIGESLDFLFLKAFGAAEYRERQVGDLLRVDLDALAGGPIDKPRLIEPAIEPFGEPAKERRLLLEVHVDAAVEDAALADILARRCEWECRAG